MADVYLVSCGQEQSDIIYGPPSYKAGDLVVIYNHLNGTLATVPSGWTTVYSNTGTTPQASGWYYRIMTADSGGTPNQGTWTSAINGTTQWWLFRRASSTFAWDAVSLATQNATGTTVTFPNLSAPGSNKKGVFLRAFHTNNTAITSSGLSGWNWSFKRERATTGQIWISDEETGSTDANTVGGNTTTIGSSVAWRSFSLLAPALLTAPPAPTIVSYSANNGGANLTPLPTHAVGDLLIVVLTRTSTTQPTKPSSGGSPPVPVWNDIDAATGTNGRCIRSAWAIATATNHSAGNWVGASGITAIVVRGFSAASPIGGHAYANNASSADCTAPAVTLTNPDGTSLLLQVHYGGSLTVGSVPSGYTRLDNNGVATLNYKNDSSSDGSVIQTYSAAATNSAVQIEVRSY